LAQVIVNITERLRVSQLYKGQHIFIVKNKNAALICINNVPACIKSLLAVSNFATYKHPKSTTLVVESSNQLIKFWIGNIMFVILALKEDIGTKDAMMVNQSMKFVRASSKIKLKSRNISLW